MNNIIELFPAECKKTGFDYEAYNRRANARCARRNLLAAVEAAATALISIGFSACLVLVFLML